MIDVLYSPVENKSEKASSYHDDDGLILKMKQKRVGETKQTKPSKQTKKQDNFFNVQGTRTYPVFVRRK